MACHGVLTGIPEHERNEQTERRVRRGGGYHPYFVCFVSHDRQGRGGSAFRAQSRRGLVMTPPELLTQLRAHGIAVTLTGTKLACRPAGRLSSADRVLLLAHKPALIEYLSRQRFAWEIFLLAEALQFPWVQLRDGVAIAGDRAGWALFLSDAPEPSDLFQAYTAVLDAEGALR